MTKNQLKYHVLGPLSVVEGDRDLTPTTPKLRALLTLLLLRHNQVVQIRELIDELWGEHPPYSAASTVQTYVYKLRRILGDDGALRTRSRGYQLVIPRDDLDLCQFERLSERGRGLLADGDPAGACAALADALSWWRGPALAGVSSTGSLPAYAMQLEERRLNTVEWRIEAELTLGRHREVISELRRLSAVHPTHDGLTMKLMTALHRSGLADEAAEVYRRVQRTLVHELGLEPSAALRRLYLSIGAEGGVPGRERRSGPPGSPAGDPGSGSGSGSDPGTGHGGARPGGAQTAVSWSYLARAASSAAAGLLALGGEEDAEQNAEEESEAPAAGLGADSPLDLRLPAAVPHLAGRRGEVGTVIGMLLRHGEEAVATPIVSITGMPGMGKTALALQVAHRVRKRFRGGVVFLGLGRPGGHRLEVADALTGLLRALAVPSDRIPSGLAERVNLFRTVIEGRRMLIVLDDVATAEEARLLIPGCPRSAVIVTGRSGLYGLAGAAILRLQGLNPDESVQLLAALLGRRRVQAERSAARRIARLCGGSPLALRCAARSLAARRDESLTAFADRLAGSPRPLDELSHEGEDLRSGYDSAYFRMAEETRAVLRRLGGLQEAEFTTGAAARVLGHSPRAADEALSRLAEHHFVKVTGTGANGELAYAFAPFVLAYAREYRERSDRF